jgi:transposase InsO family protein
VSARLVVETRERLSPDGDDIFSHRHVEHLDALGQVGRRRVVISDWKADYNHRRRHSALGSQAPAVYAAARTHQ